MRQQVVTGISQAALRWFPAKVAVLKRDGVVASSDNFRSFAPLPIGDESELFAASSLELTAAAF
jgi:hypothetical protein